MPSRAKKVAKPLIVFTLLIFLAGLHYIAFKTVAGMDFEHYYVGAKMVAAGDGASLHDPDAQFRWQAKILGGVSTNFNYPAPMALLYLPTVFLDLNHAYLLWTVMSTLMFAASVLLLNRVFGFVQDSWFLLLMCAGYLPLHATLSTGQCDAFLLLAYAISLVCLVQERPLASGLILSLVLLKFHLVLPFVLVMLLRKKWRFLCGFAAGAIAMLGVWLAICGPRLFSTYPQLVLGMNQVARGAFEPALMANLRGVFFATTGHDAPIWLLAALAMGGLVLVSRRWRSTEEGFAAAMAAMILTSYHGYVYDLILLLIPLLVASRTRTEFKGPWLIVIGTLGVPVIPYILVRSHMVWPLVVPLAVLCWMLMFHDPSASEVTGSEKEGQRIVSAAM